MESCSIFLTRNVSVLNLFFNTSVLFINVLHWYVMVLKY